MALCSKFWKEKMLKFEAEIFVLFQKSNVDKTCRENDKTICFTIIFFRKNKFIKFASINIYNSTILPENHVFIICSNNVNSLNAVFENAWGSSKNLHKLELVHEPNLAAHPPMVYLNLERISKMVGLNVVSVILLIGQVSGYTPIRKLSRFLSIPTLYQFLGSLISHVFSCDCFLAGTGNQQENILFPGHIKQKPIPATMSKLSSTLNMTSTPSITTRGKNSSISEAITKHPKLIIFKNNRMKMDKHKEEMVKEPTVKVRSNNPLILLYQKCQFLSTNWRSPSED